LAESNYRNINIVSGYRSVQEQLILWNSYPPEQRGKYVAIPGRSRHQYGIAADCDGWVKSLSNKQLIPFGLYKPMAYEDWHIEPIETMKN
jgi:LAS superfamily LD-carboxypeptidase LdcB